MAIVINGSGTITGVSAGGLPDGSVDSDTLATGIDATKLADGTVTSTELQYINTLSSNAQTQISGVGGGKILQIVYANETDQVSGSTTVSNDNTIMQNDEGVEMMTVTITPTSATSKILITGSLYVCVQTGDKHQTSGLFLDTDAGAVWGNSRYQKDGMSSGAGQLVIQYLSDAIGDTSAHTYKVRVGADTGSTYLNSGAGSAVMCGAVHKSTLTAWEIGA